jgi:hypothetical protein
MMMKRISVFSVLPHILTFVFQRVYLLLDGGKIYSGAGVLDGRTRVMNMRISD